MEPWHPDPPPGWRPTEGTFFEPTPEGWAAFRRAIAETREALARGEPSVWCPILGGGRYLLDVPRESPRILACDVDETEVRVALADGRRITAPLSWWPILRDAAPEERARHEISTRGDMVEFPLLNTEILVDYFLLCRGGADPSAFASACTPSEHLMDTVGSLLYRAAAERAKEIGPPLRRASALRTGPWTRCWMRLGGGRGAGHRPLRLCRSCAGPGSRWCR